MSHGLGRIQRAILAEFERVAVADTFHLAAVAYSVQPDRGGVKRITDAQFVATRRALAKLAEDGRVFSLRRDSGRGGRWVWANERYGVYLRLRRLRDLETSGLDDTVDVDGRAELTARAAKLGVNIDSPFQCKEAGIRLASPLPYGLPTRPPAPQQLGTSETLRNTSAGRMTPIAIPKL
jgi:hypothetical protein